VKGRHVSRLLIPALTAALLAAACSPEARYRVASFLFDGVPAPGQPEVEGYAPLGLGSPTEPDQPRPRAARRPVVAHAPFRDDQCTACHNLDTGQLTKEIRAGLCLDCHASVTADAPYLHGPVAVNDCVACHAYHASPYEGLLREDPGELCYGCHPQEDLSAEPHDATVAGQACVVCHDPHGGADRFFMK
jgi:predicted CXXCH cytochrome family protein